MVAPAADLLTLATDWRTPAICVGFDAHPAAIASNSPAVTVYGVLYLIMPSIYFRFANTAPEKYHMIRGNYRPSYLESSFTVSASGLVLAGISRATSRPSSKSSHIGTASMV